MSLHIMGGIESIRVFADHPHSKPLFTGHRHLQFGSREYERLIEQAQETGAGVYFSVNATDGRGAKAENIIRIRSYYVDIDGLNDKNPTLEMLVTSKLKPSAIVETKNGVHAYWFAAEQTPVNHERYRAVQEGLIQAFNGDASAKDIARVLRVPDTWHLKDPNDPFLVRIVHQFPIDKTPYYHAEELLTAYPSPQRKALAKPEVVISPKRWEMYLDDLAAWNPIQGERNNVMLLSAGVAIAFGVNKDTYVKTMAPIVDDWNINRDVQMELKRVANWAYNKGNPIPTAAVRARGIPIRRGL
jgi:hypothetical protein